jgi:hypothetical protein
LRISRKYVVGWLIFGGVMAVLASVGGLTSVAETFADPRLVDRVQANGRALFLGAWRSFAFVLLFAALWLAWNRGRMSGTVAAWALVALTAVDLWSIERDYWMFSSSAKVIYGSNPIIETIQSEKQPVRVFAFPLRDTPQPDALLTGDALMSHRIRQVLGYHGNQLARYQDLIGLYSQDSRILSPNVLQVTNTKYLLTNIPELPFLGNTTLAKGPVIDASGDTLYLYRLNADNPYSWVTPIAVKARDDQVLATVINPRFDVRRAALFDTSAQVAASQGVQSLPAPLSLTTTVQRYEPGNVKIALSAPAPAGSSLIVSENFYPGWTATADGRAAPIGRADYSLIGVELPQGARTIELRFTSPAYQRGKTITWLAIILGILLLGAGGWRDRRRLA